MKIGNSVGLILISALLLCTAACSIMKKNIVKNTRWQSEYKVFVADAGTEDVTVTLNFVSGKDYVLETRGVMPDHPAMYMNEDGTVPVLPGGSREASTRGTYSVDKDKVILTEEDGSVHTLYYVNGNLHSPDLSFEPLVFTKQ